MQTIPAPRFPQLDGARVASITGAIAVNGVLLLLLIAPMAAPEVVPPAPVFVAAEPVKKEVPKPERPKPVPVTKATKAPSLPVKQPAPHVETVQQVEPVVDPQQGDYKVPPTTGDSTDGKSVTPAVDDGKPMEAAHLEYASAPPPTYPREDMVAGNTGTVLLEVLVDIDGHPIEVRITRSSGYRTLDLAAKRQVLSKWTFRPAMRNGQAVQSIGMVPVEFHLDG